MKFLLGLVAIIVISLAVYVTMGSNGKQQVQKETTKTVQPTEKVSQVVVAEVNAKKSSAKNITAKSPKVVSKEPMQEMEDTDEIGKGLTLESIENANVSDEEKEIMKMDMLYYQDHYKKKYTTERDIFDSKALIINDIEKGLIH